MRGYSQFSFWILIALAVCAVTKVTVLKIIRFEGVNKVTYVWTDKN